MRNPSKQASKQARRFQRLLSAGGGWCGPGPGGGRCGGRSGPGRPGGPPGPGAGP